MLWILILALIFCVCALKFYCPQFSKRIALSIIDDCQYAVFLEKKLVITFYDVQKHPVFRRRTYCMRSIPTLEDAVTAITLKQRSKPLVILLLGDINVAREINFYAKIMAYNHHCLTATINAQVFQDFAIKDIVRCLRKINTIKRHKILLIDHLESILCLINEDVFNWFVRKCSKFLMIFIYSEDKTTSHSMCYRFLESTDLYEGYFIGFFEQYRAQFLHSLKASHVMVPLNLHNEEACFKFLQLNLISNGLCKYKEFIDLSAFFTELTKSDWNIRHFIIRTFLFENEEEKDIFKTCKLKFSLFKVILLQLLTPLCATGFWIRESNCQVSTLQSFKETEFEFWKLFEIPMYALLINQCHPIIDANILELFQKYLVTYLPSILQCEISIFVTKEQVQESFRILQQLLKIHLERFFDAVYHFEDMILKNNLFLKWEYDNLLYLFQAEVFKNIYVVTTDRAKFIVDLNILKSQLYDMFVRNSKQQ